MDRFDQMCELLLQRLGQQTNLVLSMQTNAMLVSDRWIETLIRYDIGVGISIDGPAQIHDKDRLDHNSESTYARTIEGLRKLQAASAMGLLKPPGAIAVVRPDASGAAVFRHLVRDLGIGRLSFLLPIETHDTFDISQQTNFGRYLCEVYSAWAEEEDSQVHVRFIGDIISFMVGTDLGVEAKRDARRNFSLFVIGSDGSLEPDDSLKPIADFVFSRPNIRTHTFDDFLASQQMLAVRQVSETLPEDCEDCQWRNGCEGSGGRLVNRFSKARRFNNSSILCSSLKILYSTVARSLIEGGFPERELLLAINFEPLKPASTINIMSPAISIPIAQYS